MAQAVFQWWVVLNPTSNPLVPERTGSLLSNSAAATCSRGTFALHSGRFYFVLTPLEQLLPKYIPPYLTKAVTAIGLLNLMLSFPTAGQRRLH